MKKLNRIENEHEILFLLENNKNLSIKILKKTPKNWFFEPSKIEGFKTWYATKDTKKAKFILGFNKEENEHEEYEYVDIDELCWTNINVKNFHGIINPNEEILNVLEVAYLKEKAKNLINLSPEELLKYRDLTLTILNNPLEENVIYANSKVTEFKVKNSNIIQYHFDSWKATPKRECFAIDLENFECYLVNANEQIMFKEYWLIYIL